MELGCNEQLKNIFVESITELRLEIESDVIDRLWGGIESKYEGRAYHNLEHVKYAIDSKQLVFDNPNYCRGETRDVGLEKALSDIALIYHDVEQGGDAEQRSCDLFESHFDEYFDEDSRGLFHMIKDHILTTKHSDYDQTKWHDFTGKYQNGKYAEGSVFVKDADLSILGCSDNGIGTGYNRYILDIMHEYVNQDSTDEEFEAYRIGRVEFLKNFILQPFIYQTRAYGLLYEWYARENIMRELRFHMLMVDKGRELDK